MTGFAVGRRGDYVASDAFRPRLRAYDSNETADTERNIVLYFRLWHASLCSAGRTNASVPTRAGQALEFRFVARVRAIM